MANGDVTDLVARLAGWLGRLMPGEPRRDRLIAALRAAAADRPVTADECGRLERVAWAHSRHLELHFDPAGTAVPDEEPPGWPATDAAAVRARGAGVREVRRLGDGTCLITLDGLEPWAVARPYVDGAFAVARGASRIVLDLRANGGGDPATVAGIAGRLLGDAATQLSEVVYRDRRRQWWTADRPAGSGLTGDVAVLVSGRTYSSGEALAYHLRARGRVTVVGEATAGAADHVTPVQLTPWVRGVLPEAYVRDAHTGGNWEGTGVVPDLACRAEDAVTVALDRPVQADSRTTRAGS